MSTRTPAAYRRQLAYEVRKAQDPSWTWARPREEVLPIMEAQMKRHGLSRQGLAKAAGLANKTLWEIHTGRSRSVYPETVRKLLLLPNLALPTFVPAGGTRLRVQALVVNGWGLRALKDEIAELNFYRNPRVTYVRAVEIIEFMKGKGAEFGPNLHASKIAIGKGWHAADAYDQDLLHDPLWDGQDGLLRPLTPAEKAEEARYLLACGVSRDDVRQRTGIGEEWLRQQARARATA